MNEIAWAAGLFEGEGCTELWHKTGQTTLLPRMSLQMTDKDVVERFVSAVNVGTVWGPYQNKKSLNTKGEPYKPMYRWAIVRITEIQRILRLFWVYLGQRRRAKAAEVFAVYYEHPRRPPGRPLQPCGTPAAYKRHIKKNETPCTDCIEAERSRGRARYAKRIEIKSQ